MGTSGSTAHEISGSDKAEIRLREAADVRQHDRQIRGADAKPRRQRSRIFINTRRRNPRAARAGIVGAADREIRHLAVDIATVDRTADHEVIRTPAVIGAVAVRVVGAAEVRCREGRDLVFAAELDRGAIERRHIAAHIGEEIRVRAELCVVEIPAADAREENLTLEPERRSRGDEPRDGAELVAEGRGRERGLKRRRRRENPGEHCAVGNRVAGETGEGRLEEVAVARREQVVLRAHAQARGVRARGRAAARAVERHRSGGIDRELDDVLADLKRVLPVQADRHRDIVVRIERRREVRKPATPARGERLVRHAALPLDLLVVVRKKLRRQRHGARGVLRLRRRHDQRADVADQRHLARVEERLEAAVVRVGDVGIHAGVQPPLAAVARLRREAEDLVARQSDRATACRRGVGVVARRVERHDHVVRVVAAREEEAHERLVVGGQCPGARGRLRAVVRAGHRAHHAELREGGQHAGGAHRRTARAEEFAPGGIDRRIFRIHGLRFAWARD